MRPVSLWIGGLGAILGVLAAVLVLFGPGDWLGYSQLAAAAAGAAGIAVLGLVAERRPGGPRTGGGVACPTSRCRRCCS